MNATRQVPCAGGTKYYLERYLREDFIQFGIVVKTDANGAVTSLSFNSHRLGTVDIESDRSVQCYRWEDEEQAQKTSPVVKHYPVITGVREKDRDFAAAVVSEVLEHIGNEYLREILSDFFLTRETAPLDPTALPGAAQMYESTNAVQTLTKTSAPPPRAQESGPGERVVSRTPYASRPPRARPAPTKLDRFERWRMRFDLVGGLAVLGLILGMLLSADDLRRVIWNYEPDLFCDDAGDMCLRLERGDPGESPRMVLTRKTTGRTDNSMTLALWEPAPNFFVSDAADTTGGNRICYVLQPSRLLWAPCRFNDRNYGHDYVSIFLRDDGRLECYHNDRGPRKMECRPTGAWAASWMVFRRH